MGLQLQSAPPWGLLDMEPVEARAQVDSCLVRHGAEQVLPAGHTIPFGEAEESSRPA